jgi:uncharacterized protein YutE (UPF0331/DUF86 family)
LKKLEPFKKKSRDEILQDSYLQDIVERNLQVAAQAIIDIANRIIAIEELKKPRDYYEAVLRLGEATIIPLDFAKELAPIAGFRNILVHDYLDIDWNEVFTNLNRLDELSTYMQYIKTWLKNQTSGPKANK